MNVKQKAIDIYSKYLTIISDTFYDDGSFTKKEGRRALLSSIFHVEEIMSSETIEDIQNWQEILNLLNSTIPFDVSEIKTFLIN